MCPAGMPLSMLLQTCRHNFLDRIEVHMGAVKTHTWKELVEKAEIAEKSAKKFEPSVPKNKWGVNTKGHDAARSSQSKGKKIMALSYQGQLNQSRRVTPMTIRNSNFCQRCTPLKMNRWRWSSTSYTRVTILNYLKFGDLIKWDVQMILTTSFLEDSASPYQQILYPQG